MKALGVIERIGDIDGGPIWRDVYIAAKEQKIFTGSYEAYLLSIGRTELHVVFDEPLNVGDSLKVNSGFITTTTQGMTNLKRGDLVCAEVSINGGDCLVDRVSPAGRVPVPDMKPKNQL